MNITDLQKTQFVRKNNEVKDGFEEMIMHRLMHEAVSKVADKLKVDKVDNHLSGISNKQFVSSKKRNKKYRETFDVTL